MTGRLEGKTAIVVGAGQTPGATIGNGRSTTVRFGREGARVICADHRVDSAGETADSIRRAGGDAFAIEAEVTDEHSMADLIAASLRRLDRIDILHNNVGIGTGDAGATSITGEAWDRIMDVNLKGVVLAGKHSLPSMREAGSGVILDVSSIAAACSVDIVAYKSSKAAVDAYPGTGDRKRLARHSGQQHHARAHQDADGHRDLRRCRLRPGRSPRGALHHRRVPRRRRWPGHPRGLTHVSRTPERA